MLNSWVRSSGPRLFSVWSDAEPLLGVTALESVGIEVDPRNQSLKRLPSTRLRGSRVMG